jgi:Translationally controlled tumour protein
LIPKQIRSSVDQQSPSNKDNNIALRQQQQKQDESTMIIYKCRFTGDEMLSDAFKPGPVKDEEGNVVEGLLQIKSQKVNKVRLCQCCRGSARK